MGFCRRLCGGNRMATQVLLKVEESGAGAERLADLAQALRGELLALDVDDVRPVRDGAPPSGSRGIDVAAAGALVASLSGSVEALGPLLRTVREWLGRGAKAAPRTVELTIGDKTLRVTNASDAQQDRLIEAFISAVAGS
jgi:hypothetical protein